MKRVLTGIVVVLLGIVLLPWTSPLFGLDAHRRELAPPGQRVAIGDGAFLNSYEYGNGERVLVLTHGVPGSAAMMRPLAESLARRGFRVITYDRLGWAHSSARPADSTADPTSNARDLLALSAAVGTGRSVLVGYSYGGGVVQEANRLAPEIPACNVLISSIGPGVRRPAARASWGSRLMFSRPMLQWALAITPIAMQVSAPNMRALYAPEAPAGLEEVYEFLAALELSVEIWRRELDERYLRFTEFVPEAVSQPTLILHGIEDQTVPVRIAEDLHKAIIESELVLLPETGHAMVLTRHEALADSITEFVNRCTPEHSSQE